jgi:hypothetical protein
MVRYTTQGRVVMEMVCMRCTGLRPMQPVPEHAGTRFDPVNLATVYIDDASRKLVVTRHNPGCPQLDPQALSYHAEPVTSQG